jgi:uncharacterized protein (TIGR02145 family)
MKTKSTVYWNSPIEGATNESGFSALPGGVRDNNGGFSGIRGSAFFWSAAEYDDKGAWGRGLSQLNSFVYGGYYYKALGASVRCLRD